MGVLVRSTLGQLPVRELDRIQADVALQLTVVNRVTETAAEAAHRLRVLSLLLFVAAIVTTAAAIALAAQWRRAVQLLGFSVAGFAVAAVLLLTGARVAVERLSSDRAVDRRAAGAVWDAFLGDLSGLLLLVAALAIVVAAAVASEATLPNLGPALRRGWELASRTPRRTVWRVARGVALAVRGRGDRALPAQCAAAGRDRGRPVRALRRASTSCWPPPRRGASPAPRSAAATSWLRSRRSAWASSRSPSSRCSWRAAARPRRPWSAAPPATARSSCAASGSTRSRCPPRTTRCRHRPRRTGSRPPTRCRSATSCAPASADC